MKHLILILLSAIVVTPASSRTPAQKPAFDAATIKRSTGKGPGSIPVAMGGRYSATSATLLMLLGSAYQPADGSGLTENRIVGAPRWADTDRFDVEGKTAGGPGILPPATFQPMLQTLLVDHFRLKTHWETRELSVYNLVVAKNQPKMKFSDDQTHLNLYQDNNLTYDLSVPPPRGTTQIIPNAVTGLFVIRGTAISVSTLPRSLMPFTRGYPVVDETHLLGLYDVRLEFDPILAPSASPEHSSSLEESSPMDATGKTIFAAVQEQLGLKLMSAKASVAVLVIDSVQRPSEN